MRSERNFFNKNQTDINSSVENDRFSRFSTIIYSIRAICILLIIIFHIGYWFLTIRLYSNIYLLMIYDFALIGLDLFFFLSGMLLVFNLLNFNYENLSWVNWYKKRVIRIFPAYWLMLSLIIFLQFIIFGNIYELCAILINFSGFQALYIDNPNFIIIHFIYWYITIILSCYIIFPLLFIALRKNFKGSILIGVILFALFFYFNDNFAIIIKILSKITTIQSGTIEFFFYKYFVFFFGMVFGYWIGENNMENLEKMYELKIGITLSILLTITFLMIIIGYLRWVFPFITFIFIPFLLFLFNKFFKANKFLTFFGKKSYEIYLVHSFIHIILFHVFFDLISLPVDLVFELLILSIWLIIVFLFAYLIQNLGDQIIRKEEIHKYIYVFALSLFIFTSICIFLVFILSFIFALCIYVSIILILILFNIFYKKRLKRFENLNQN
ncbi:MAG: acyltransferase [Promethearchaeota archaeon]|nr:MAG: acyltransferase [Candidatus Lokiarchaeota archaeon]